MYKLQKCIIPTYVLEEGDTADMIPEDNAYIIASGGIYCKTTQEFYSAVFKTSDPIQSLAKIEEVAYPSIPRIPLGLMKVVTAFFEGIYKKFQTEVCAILHYNPTAKTWYVDIPKQEVSFGAVTYDREKTRRFKDHVRMGSIHSHASMGAFHSGTDDKDEESFDGIHITIGHLDKEEKEYCARLMCGGKFFKLNFLESMNDNVFDLTEPPAEWYDMVERKVWTNTYQGCGATFFDGEDYYRRRFFQRFLPCNERVSGPTNTETEKETAQQTKVCRKRSGRIRNTLLSLMPFQTEENKRLKSIREMTDAELEKLVAESTYPQGQE